MATATASKWCRKRLLSLLNLLYNVTEFFEFAARLWQAVVYKWDLNIKLGKTWSISSASLIAGSAEHSLADISSRVECFGWVSPNLEALRMDQQKLLTAKL